MQALLDARTEKEDQVFWSAESTGVYSTGASAAIETTGLATQALLKWGQASETARKALNFISQKKQASGAWGTTQATIMALRALLLSTQLGAADVHGSLQVMLDGREVKTLNLTASNNDLLHQFVFKGIDAHRPASVRLHFEGTGSLAYQVVGRSFIPWEEKPAAEPLSINIAYDRTRLPQNDIATETVTIRNNLGKTANMVMVDLGIPPGFDLLSEDLQSFQEKASGPRQSWTAGEVQPHRNPGHPLLQWSSAAPGSHAEGPFARQIPHTRAHLAVAPLRVLRPRRELDRKANKAGSGWTIDRGD